ncbi:MAG: hypothetical protein IIB90_18735, partial [Gemmatimonadetes bacterium]|nr:hypothetical protein [Gemmatimonadota bacterium]
IPLAKFLLIVAGRPTTSAAEEAQLAHPGFRLVIVKMGNDVGPFHVPIGHIAVLTSTVVN